jgi:hypothetical protein
LIKKKSYFHVKKHTSKSLKRRINSERKSERIKLNMIIIYSRMIWSDEKKGWMLRRNKRKTLVIPPVIEATKKDAYEDVFRKREIQAELDKSKLKLRKMQKTVKKIKK